MLRNLLVRLLPSSAVEMIRLLRRDDWTRRMLAAQELDIRLAEETLRATDGIVVDVGAERGEVALHFAARGYRVLAFEPSRPTAIALRLRSLRYPKLRVREEACGAEDGVGHLDESGASWERSLAAAGRPVKIVRLADVVDEPISLLKVDAEGHDLDVLRGYFGEGKALPTTVMFEFTRDSLDAPLELLRDVGYTNFRFVCRWQEAAGLPYQPRIAVFDGEHPLVRDATWGNVLASQRSFRVVDRLVPGA